MKMPISTTKRVFKLYASSSKNDIKRWFIISWRVDFKLKSKVLAKSAVKIFINKYIIHTCYNAIKGIWHWIRNIV